MSISPLSESPSSYIGKKASEYDDRSEFDKGDRNRQAHLLRCILEMDEQPVVAFCDLGCGSGFLAEQVCATYRSAQGLCVDISTDMLALAEERLKVFSGRVEFMQIDMRQVDWSQMRGRLDLVVSCLAIHHLSDAEKGHCFAGIFDGLAPGGRFILYDLVHETCKKKATFLERLAVTDIRSNFLRAGLINESSSDWSLDQMVHNDGEIRSAEGDQESSVEVLSTSMEAAGFPIVIEFYRDNRISGIFAQKMLA